MALALFRPFCQTPLQLANPTQLQLVGVGVDFVFLRKEEEEGRNPHLASSRRNDPTCLNFGSYLVDVYGSCLEGVWWLSGVCLNLRVSGGYLWNV